MNKIAVGIIAWLGAAHCANAENVMLSCIAEETAAKHARRSFEIAVDRQNQLVYIGKTVSTAAITDTSITFRVDLGTGIPFSFAIDRTTGFISVSGSVGVLYKGQCKVATRRDLVGVSRRPNRLQPRISSSPPHRSV